MRSLVPLVLTLLPAVAWAGYGDAEGGYPWPNERLLHLWTNAARVDPAAFEEFYNQGGCSYDTDFSEDEQTPKPPLLYQHDLNDAARFHSKDMVDNGCFQHESCDGTAFADRLAQYYPSSQVGENIAMGYGGEFNSVFVGWMCSTHGHRANIMSSGWDELGTGTISDYMTQDFGYRGVEPQHAVMMAADGAADGTTRDFWADSWHEDEKDPDEIIVVLDGVAVPMEKEYGETWRGIWHAQADAGESGCHQYYVQATWGDEITRFPTDGSYGFGDSCDYDDADAQWFDSQMGIAGRDDKGAHDLAAEFSLIGCDSTGSPASALASGVALLLALSRRQGRARSE